MSAFKDLAKKQKESKKKKMTLRDKILGCVDIQEEVMEIEEWDCSIVVRELPAATRYEMMDVLRDFSNMTEGKKNATIITEFAKVMVHCVLDPDTKQPLFHTDDIHALSRKNESVLVRIGNKIFELSGIGKKAQEDIEKN
jgi:hypothetical protein